MFDLYDARVISRKTQTELAEATGLSLRKVSLIERGRIRPNLEEKKRLANALALRTFEIKWEVENVEAQPSV